MSPRHFSKAMFRRQSQKEREMEAAIEHAISFAFSPVMHTIKTWGNLKRVFKSNRKQSES